jgi:hypothetical protein
VADAALTAALAQHLTDERVAEPQPAAPALDVGPDQAEPLTLLDRDAVHHRRQQRQLDRLELPHELNGIENRRWYADNALPK